MSNLYHLTKTELKKKISEHRKEIKRIETEIKRREKKEPETFQTILEFSDGKKRPVYTLVDMTSAPYGQYFPAALKKTDLFKNPDGPGKIAKFSERESSEGGSDYDYGHTYYYHVDRFRFRWNKDFLGYDKNGKKL